MDKTIYIIETIYHGKNEDLYETYPHESMDGAEDHYYKIIQDFIKEHDSKKPTDMEIIGCSASIEYGELFNDNLQVNIHEKTMLE